MIGGDAISSEALGNLAKPRSKGALSVAPIALTLLLGCGGNAADVCADGYTVQIQASAEATACLNARCTDVPTCYGVTAGQPICYVETNGGQLIGTWACAPCACGGR